MIFHEYVNGAVPTVGVIVIVPVAVPQFAGVALITPWGNGFTLTVSILLLEQPPKGSIAVTVYVVVEVGDTDIDVPVSPVLHE